MAPIKRPRPVIDDGDTETIEVESAQSSLQQTSVGPFCAPALWQIMADCLQRKKLRVSYEDPDDAMSEEATDEELLEAQATQIRSKKLLDNEPAENGILETVICTNFMCHGYLEIGLGPLINFIIGQYVLSLIFTSWHYIFPYKSKTLIWGIFLAMGRASRPC